GLGHWTDYIHSKYSIQLAMIGLSYTSWLGDLTLVKNNNTLQLLVSLWRHMCHTFIASWSEFTITLEDVCELLGLEAAITPCLIKCRVISPLLN
ncbi:hypothetical protein G3V86_24615, partial [Escherichia coli]|nr:hypothetical protein [Escherichia coli]